MSFALRSLRDRRAAAVLVGAFLAVMVALALVRPFLHGDTKGLVNGARGIVDCVRDHRFTHCDRTANGLETGAGPNGFVQGNVGDFPLLQYVPAAVLRATGLSTTSTLRVLIAIDALALCGIVAISWRTARRFATESWARLLVAALLGGPLLWYALSGFGEELAAFVILGATAAVLTARRPWIVATFVALACISKESNPPFVLALTVAALLATRVDRAAFFRRAAPIAIGAGTGIALDALFNIFRFGSVWNTAYFQAPYHTPGPRIAAKLLAALWFAPNGGVVWFWPAALAFLALAAWRAQRRIAAWIAVAVVVGEVSALASWYSPFGWAAWGPRLALPLIPAALLVATAATSGRPLRIGAPARWAISGALAVAAAPNIGVGFLRDPYGTLFAHDSVCVGAHVETARDSYYRCLVHTAWARPSALRHGLHGVTAPFGAIAFVLFALAIASLVAIRPGGRETRAADPRSTRRGELPVPDRTEAGHRPL